MQVVLKVTSLQVAAKYGSCKIVCHPAEDTFYAIELSEKQYTKDQFDYTVLNQAGVKHILKGMQVALITE